jgi:hypothetical protein
VPTVAEAGLPGFDYSLWVGMFAPAGTPADVVDKIARDVRTVAQSTDVKERFAALGAEPIVGRAATTYAGNPYTATRQSRWRCAGASGGYHGRPRRDTAGDTGGAAPAQNYKEVRRCPHPIQAA